MDAPDCKFTSTRMVFAAAARDHGVVNETPSQNNYEWAAVKAVRISEEEKKNILSLIKMENTMNGEWI